MGGILIPPFNSNDSPPEAGYFLFYKNSANHFLHSIDNIFPIKSTFQGKKYTYYSINIANFVS